MTLVTTAKAFRREWRLVARDPRMLLTLVVVAALTLLALVTGWERVQQRREHQLAIEQDNARQRLFLKSAFEESSSPAETDDELSQADRDRRFALQMSARSPDLMRFTGGLWTAYLPASPLAGLSVGSAGEWPAQYRHAGLSVARTLKQETTPNPFLAVTGPYDMTVLVGVILPLAVLILTFDVTAADRENGRWTLVETHSPSIANLVGIRCLVRVAALATVVSLLIVAWTVTRPIGQFDAGTLGQLAALCGWIFAYTAFWGALAFLVASFKTSSSGAGLVLLLFWSMLVLVVPSFVEKQLNIGKPIPNRADLVAIEERAQETVADEAESVWEDYLRDHPDVEFDDDNPQLEYLLRDVAQQHAVRSKVDDWLSDYFGQYRERENRIDRLQLLSPPMAWRTIAHQYSGTSTRHYTEFASATAAFHGDFVRYFEPMTLAGRELTQTDIEKLPRFNADSLANRLYSSPLLYAALTLVAWTCVCSFLGWLRLRRPRRGNRSSSVQ